MYVGSFVAVFLKNSLSICRDTVGAVGRVDLVGLVEEADLVVQFVVEDVASAIQLVGHGSEILGQVRAIITKAKSIFKPLVKCANCLYL